MKLADIWITLLLPILVDPRKPEFFHILFLSKS
jgi:hypothetical protein